MTSPVPRSAARGFTLIEAMIALVVLAIMVALAVPAWRDWRNRVRTAQAQSDILGLEASIEFYRNTRTALPATLADLGLPTPIDPWGRPYVYYNVEANGPGGARKDHALNPLNTDYDLYSVGADGLSAMQITLKSSLDDIIRASNGGYVGLASGF